MPDNDEQGAQVSRAGMGSRIGGYGMGFGGARVDVDGDGIPDMRVGPYGQVRPDVGTFVKGPPIYGPGMYPGGYY